MTIMRERLIKVSAAVIAGGATVLLAAGQASATPVAGNHSLAAVRSDTRGCLPSWESLPMVNGVGLNTEYNSGLVCKHTELRDRD